MLAQPRKGNLVLAGGSGEASMENHVGSENLGTVSPFKDMHDYDPLPPVSSKAKLKLCS